MRHPKKDEKKQEVKGRNVDFDFESDDDNEDLGLPAVPNFRTWELMRWIF